MGKIIINERQYNHIVNFIKETRGLDSKSQNIINDILNTLNEGTGFIDKVKAYANKGLLTTTILSALLASPKLTNAQKSELKSVYNTDVSLDTTQNKNSVVSTKKMTEWNVYAKWLKTKGLSGSKKMNSIQFSKQTMDEFKKEHPEMSLSYEDVSSIQKAIQRYRAYCISEINAGRANKDSTVKPDFSNFMTWAIRTPNDGIVGEFTSQFLFPKTYLKLQNGKSLDVGYGDPAAGGSQTLKNMMNKQDSSKIGYNMNDSKKDKTN